MKSLVAWKALAGKALATVGTTAASKAAVIITTVTVAGAGTAGVATVAAHNNEAKAAQAEMITMSETDRDAWEDAVLDAYVKGNTEKREKEAAEKAAFEKMMAESNVISHGSEAAKTSYDQITLDPVTKEKIVIPVEDLDQYMEEDPLIGHRICNICLASVGIYENSGINMDAWKAHCEWHKDKNQYPTYTDVYGDEDPIMEYEQCGAYIGRRLVKKADVKTEDKDKSTDITPVNPGTGTKPADKTTTDKTTADKTEETKPAGKTDAEKKAEEEAAKKAAEDEARKAEAEKKAAEEAARKKAEAEKKAAEEAAAKKAAEEEARKQAEKEALRKRLEATAESSNSTISEETYEYLLSDEMLEQTKAAQDAVDAEAARQEAILKAYEEQCQREREAREAERAAREAEQAELEALRAQGLIP